MPHETLSDNTKSNLLVFCTVIGFATLLDVSDRLGQKVHLIQNSQFSPPNFPALRLIFSVLHEDL